MRTQFLIQPYKVGSKTSKSLAVVIPSKIVERYNINPSTGFILNSCEQGILLQFVDTKKKNLLPIDPSLAAEQSTGRYVSEGDD